MSKNLTRKGIAFGALVALATSTFAGAPASAAVSDSIVTGLTSGTSYNSVVGYANELSLSTVLAPSNSSNAGTAVAPSITPSNANQKRLVTIYGISDGNATTDGRSLAPPAGQTERVEVVAGATAYSRLMIGADESGPTSCPTSQSRSGLRPMVRSSHCAECNEQEKSSGCGSTGASGA